MAGGLEEPILSTLGQENNLAGTFMNAFAKVSAINNQKRHLEATLAQMQANENYKQQDHELDKEKFAFDQKYKMGQLARGYDQMEQRAYLAEKGHEFTAAQNNIKAAAKDAAYENASTLGDELAAATQKYPIDSQAFTNEMNVIATKHGGTLATPEGQRVWKTFSAQSTAASNEAHKYATELRRNFDSSLSMSGQGNINRADFLQPDSVWQTGKGPKGEATKFLARVPEPVPGSATGQMRYRVIGPDEVKKLGEEGKQDQVRYDTMPAKNYKQLRAMHNRMMQIGGTDLSEKPADTGVPVPSSQDIEYLKNNPNKAGRFEARFGDGSAGKYLNSEQ